MVPAGLDFNADRVCGECLPLGSPFGLFGQACWRGPAGGVRLSRVHPLLLGGNGFGRQQSNAVDQDASPLFFNFVRMVVAAAALGIVFYRGIAQITRESFVAGALAGAFLWLGYEFQTTGLRLTTASKIP